MTYRTVTVNLFPLIFKKAGIIKFLFSFSFFFFLFLSPRGLDSLQRLDSEHFSFLVCSFSLVTSTYAIIDDMGKDWTLPCVRMAEEKLHAEHLTHEYQPFSGVKGFSECAARFAFSNCDALRDNRVSRFPVMFIPSHSY